MSNPNIQSLWDTMKINRVAKVKDRAKLILDRKNRYDPVAAETRVPWYLIGAIHDQESSMNFTRWLGNGEPYDRKSRLVPRGYGPFSSWEEGAVVALLLKKQFIPKDDWGIPHLLDFAERYNGYGYRRYGINSPYVWAYTDHYTAGHFVADGRFVRSAVRKKPGVAPVIKTLFEDFDVLMNG